MERLWGDHYFYPIQKKWKSSEGLDGNEGDKDRK